MSRTDAHRPARVWVNDHPELVVEVHDHRDGVCDLGGVPSGERADVPQRRGSCYAELDRFVKLCSCPLCTLRLGRTRARRSQRTAWRAWQAAAQRSASPEELEWLEGRALARRRLL